MRELVSRRSLKRGRAGKFDNGPVGRHATCCARWGSLKRYGGLQVGHVLVGSLGQWGVGNEAEGDLQG